MSSLNPRARWLKLFPRGSDFYVDIAARYAEPHRHYHTLTHICAMLDILDARCPNDTTLALAVWFHDVIYDPKRNDNEERSAEYAKSVIPSLGGTPGLCSEIARMIMLTKTHDAVPDLADRLFLDADLAILGSDEASYDAYAVAIRREYDWVPEQDYRAGRTKILERFLARPKIFLTGMLADLENPARANLKRELCTLTG